MNFYSNLTVIKPVIIPKINSQFILKMLLKTNNWHNKNGIAKLKPRRIIFFLNFKSKWMNISSKIIKNKLLQKKRKLYKFKNNKIKFFLIYLKAKYKKISICFFMILWKTHFSINFSNI